MSLGIRGSSGLGNHRRLTRACEGKRRGRDAGACERTGAILGNLSQANGHPAAAVRLRKALPVVDFTYLFAHFYSLDMGVPSDGHGQQRQTLYQGLSGVPPEDDVIDESVRRQFDGWIRAVYNRLNGGFADILNVRNRLPQALDETETQY